MAKRRWSGIVTLVTVLGASSTAHALTPQEVARGFVEGTNHHQGNNGFVAVTGRAPTPDDPEAARMHTHLTYVRNWLAARPATRPEHAVKRAEILGYLDEYIAHGVTPWNLSLARRNPVFVDEFGNVCAVGYLIQRSVGRGLVDRIAAEHRFDYLEDIDTPELRRWVETSGFTLEELASIQPGYVAPAIQQWQTWNLRGEHPADGSFQLSMEGLMTHGSFQAGEMSGRWMRSDGLGHVLGRGEFERGAGHWVGYRTDGTRLVEGNYQHSEPEGEWTFYHPSGRVAAKGTMHLGNRDGAWIFYHDVPGEWVASKGRFARGMVDGEWRHFDVTGTLVATAQTERAPTGVRGGFRAHGLTLATTRLGLSHRVHQATVEGDHHRLDELRMGGLHVYLQPSFDSERVFDEQGNELSLDAGHWMQARCAWSSAAKRAARTGNLATLHALLVRESPTCAQPTALSNDKAEAIEAMLRELRSHHAQTPAYAQEWVRRSTDGETQDPALVGLGTDDTRANDGQDFGEMLANHMSWYVEWPHIDLLFAQAFATLPGHFTAESPMEGHAIAVVPLWERESR